MKSKSSTIATRAEAHRKYDSPITAVKRLTENRFGRHVHFPVRLFLRNFGADIDYLYVPLISWSGPFEMYTELTFLHLTVPWTEKVPMGIVGISELQLFAERFLVRI